MDASQIGKRAWSYAGVLQDAGLSCFEYVEQLTLLLFLKMADQLTQPPYEREPLVPPELGWQPLLRLDGEALETQFRKSLEALAKEPGIRGCAGQRALRGWRWREGTAQPLGKVPRPHLAAAAHRHLVFTRREGQRDLLRQERGARQGVDGQAVDLRSAHQQALHLEAESRSAARISTSSSPATSLAAPTPAGRLGAKPTRKAAGAERDKLSLDIFWIKDDSLTDTSSLPPPEVLASEIAADLKAAQTLFEGIAKRLAG